jgi:hypothetical protein
MINGILEYRKIFLKKGNTVSSIFNCKMNLLHKSGHENWGDRNEERETKIK